ncbi:MAG: hypothetical protein WDO18_18390 [Acidobacteriota bacterium]
MITPADFFQARAGNLSVDLLPSANGFDLDAAYALENDVMRLREQAGQKTAGRKVGYANKAMWRMLKLNTLVWAHMFDDTVHFAPQGKFELSVRQKPFA